MIVEDFVSFGRTVPEKSKKYGEKVCCAGYSAEMRRLLRIFPIPPQFKIKARHKYRIHCERNKFDSRDESWAIKNRLPELAVNDLKYKANHDELRQFLEKNTAPSIGWLNDKRRSLGIIRPNSYRPTMMRRKTLKDKAQITLFDDFIENNAFKTAGDFFSIPYLYFTDDSSHRLQIREWGLYELLRKYTLRQRILTDTDIVKSLYLGDDKDVFLIVGNMAHIRTVWLIIKVITFKKKEEYIDIFS